jgi:LysM repeat protein
VKPSFWKTGFAILIALALIAGTLPLSASAATKCVAYYTVQEGDTTPKISKTFGLKWREIAKANDLELAWKPVPGTNLCIPAEGSATSGTSGSGISTTTSVPSDSNASFSAQAAGNKITITGAGFKNKQVFNVKVRDAGQNSGGWVKVGLFKIPKNTTKTQSYVLPDALRDDLYLQICLKNASTDELICRKVLHTQ